MNPPKMVAADTPDRGRMWYLVDDNLDFISEVKLFLDWKAATRRAPATIKAYCSRLLWFYRFLAKLGLQVEEVTPTHLTEFVIWLQHPGRAYAQQEPLAGAQPLAASSMNLIVRACCRSVSLLSPAWPHHPITRCLRCYLQGKVGHGS